MSYGAEFSSRSWGLSPAVLCKSGKEFLLSQEIGGADGWLPLTSQTSKQQKAFVF